MPPSNQIRPGCTSLIAVDSADHATSRAKDASRDLPVADRLGALLHDATDGARRLRWA